MTTVARTLLDLAATAPQRHVERALDQAEILRVFDARALEEQLSRANGRATKRLAAALARHRDGPTLTRSELEEAFLARRIATEPERVARDLQRLVDSGPPHPS